MIQKKSPWFRQVRDIDKGGHNIWPSQVTERPPKPTATNPSRETVPLQHPIEGSVIHFTTPNIECNVTEYRDGIVHFHVINGDWHGTYNIQTSIMTVNYTGSSFVTAPPTTVVK